MLFYTVFSIFYLDLFFFSGAWWKSLCLLKHLHFSNCLFSLNSSTTTESTNLLSPADLITASRKKPKISKYSIIFQVYRCFYVPFTNKVSSQTSCISTSFLSYTHQEALYSGYANIRAKLQDLLVKMSCEICISKKEKSYIAREVYERIALILCEWLQACPIDSSSHAPSSNSVSSSPLKLKFTKYPVPSPNQGHNATTILFRPRHPLLLHEKLEPLHPLASVLQLHTPTVSEVFFSKERHIKFQTLLAPGCTSGPSAFLC